MLKKWPHLQFESFIIIFATIIQIFKGGKSSSEETIQRRKLLFYDTFDTLTLSAQKGFQSTSVNISLLTNIEILATIVFFLHKNFLFLGNML